MSWSAPSVGSLSVHPDTSSRSVVSRTSRALVGLTIAFKHSAGVRPKCLRRTLGSFPWSCGPASLPHIPSVACTTSHTTSPPLSCYVFYTFFRTPRTRSAVK